MRRHADLTFLFTFFFFTGLIDIWPISHSGPSVLRVFLTKFPIPPHEITPPLVRSIVVSPLILRKGTCIMVDVSVVVCFCVVTDLHF